MIIFAEKGAKLTDIEQNKARVRAFFDAFNCGDVEAVVNAYSDEGSCYSNDAPAIYSFYVHRLIERP